MDRILCMVTECLREGDNPWDKIGLVHTCTGYGWLCA